MASTSAAVQVFSRFIGVILHEIDIPAYLNDGTSLLTSCPPRESLVQQDPKKGVFFVLLLFLSLIFFNV